MPNHPQKAIIKYRKITANNKQLLPNQTASSYFYELKGQPQLNIRVQREKSAIRQMRNLEKNLGDRPSLRIQTHAIQYPNDKNIDNKSEVVVANPIRDINKKINNPSKLNSLQKSLISKNKRNQRLKQNPFKDRQKDIKAKFNILSEKKKLSRLASDKQDPPNKYDSLHRNKNKKTNLQNSLKFSKVNIAVILDKHSQISRKRSIFKGVQGKQLKISNTINYNKCCDYFEKQFMFSDSFEQEDTRFESSIVNTQYIFINTKRVPNRNTFRTMMDGFDMGENNVKNKCYRTVEKYQNKKQSHRIRSEQHRDKTAEKFSPWETETNNNEQQYLLYNYEM